MTTKVQPWAVLGRVLRIYREQAAVLLPMAATVAAITALARHLPVGPALLMLLVDLVASALLAGAVIQLAHATLCPAADRSARALARGSVRAVLPAVALGLAQAFVGVPAVVVVALALAGDGGSGSSRARFVVLGVLLVTVFLWIVLAIRWVVTLPVAVIERRGVGASLRRSWRLVRGQGWRVLAAAALVYVPALALTTLARIVTAGSGTAAGLLVPIAVGTATWPVATLMPPVLYRALLDSAPADEPSEPDPSNRPPRWLLRGTRWRVALWSGLALAWFLFLPDYLATAPRPLHPSVVGAAVWTVVLALLVRCAWATARRLRAVRAGRYLHG